MHGFHGKPPNLFQASQHHSSSSESSSIMMASPGRIRRKASFASVVFCSACCSAVGPLLTEGVAGNTWRLLADESRCCETRSSFVAGCSTFSAAHRCVVAVPGGTDTETRLQPLPTPKPTLLLARPIKPRSSSIAVFPLTARTFENQGSALMNVFVFSTGYPQSSGGSAEQVLRGRCQLIADDDLESSDVDLMLGFVARVSKPGGTNIGPVSFIFMPLSRDVCIAK